jgi:integrase
MTAGRPRLKRLSTVEVDRLLDSLRGRTVRPLLVLTAGMGMRPSEATGVRCDDVDVIHGTLAVPRRTTAARNVVGRPSTDSPPEAGEH